ncbi:MepB family protein [Streptomyces sp. NRRL F-2747]|uniref:MepB family protein n=1 Tax=Streptomyces sp. NRRL F-2747 TaxID=1463843 RepID=UPI0004CA03D5|nr:MepB family protein [Streptomyces sp. NRRL F-2747]
MTTRRERSADPRPTPAGPEAWPDATRVPDGLLAAKTRVYDPCGFTCSQPVPEAEGGAYAAHAFTLDGRAVRFRVAKTTPTKAGQFVTVWMRSPQGPIRPFDTADGVDLFVIAGHDDHGCGQFVFPVDALRRHGVVSVDGAGGKRGFRVYPPWVATTSRQADRTQAWQVEHFLHLPQDGPVDLARAVELYRS